MQEMLIFAKVIVTEAMKQYNSRLNPSYKREAIVEMTKDLEELKKAYAVVAVEPLNVEDIVDEAVKSITK